MVCGLSIIVPIYNSEKYLENCIDSILNQTMDNYEIILINDGSTDNSEDICRKYVKKFKNIHAIKTKNNGASSARNLGITLAKGEYIGFIDSDDIIESKMYEKMYQFAKDNDLDIVACSYKETDINNKILKINKVGCDEHKIIQGENIKKEYELELAKNSFLGYASMCNKIYRLKYIRDSKLFVNTEIRIAEDLCFNIESIMSCNKVGIINEVLYNYRRINSDSIMSSQKKYELKDIECRLKARNAILKTLDKYIIDREVYDNYVKYENHITVSDFLSIVIEIIKSKVGIYKKTIKFSEILYNEDFIKALYNTHSKYFHSKAKFIIFIMKILYRCKINSLFLDGYNE